MRVVFFHRKKAEGNFSIENLFDTIRQSLPKEISWTIKHMRFRSKGIIRRLYITAEAFLTQGEINHVTGDIHFVAILLRKSRTILTIHDLGFMTRSNSLARFLFKWFWIRLPVYRSAVITTISEATKSSILKYAKIDPEKIRVIYNPISPSFSAHPKKINKEEPVILQIGTKFNKNIPRLAEALHGIRCRLHVVGKLDAGTIGVLKMNHINFTEFNNLTEEEIIDQYIHSDIVTFVSTLEGFGLPIVEANAVGRAVVTSNRSSMPEVAGGAAHLVDPLDINSIRAGILKLIEDDAYREQLIVAGYDNVKRFSVSIIAKQYSDLYTHLYDGKTDQSLQAS